MLVSAESQVPKLISRKLFLRHSNACDHNPPTSQTDRRKDRQTIYRGNTALRYASRGRNGHNFATGLPIMPIDVMFRSRVGFPAELRFLP